MEDRTPLRLAAELPALRHELRTPCHLDVFIDGVRQFGQETLFLQHSDEIAFVEAYPRGMMVPPELTVPHAQCDVVAIWTKRRMP